MEEQELSPSEVRAEMKRAAEVALLTAIKESAEKFDQPSQLRDLAEAYAAVMEHKAPAEQVEEPKGSKAWTV